MGVDDDEEEDDDGVDEVVAAGFDDADGGRFRDVFAMMKYQLFTYSTQMGEPQNER